MNEISTIKNHTEYRKLQISQYNHRCGNTRIFLDITFFLARNVSNGYLIFKNKADLRLIKAELGCYMLWLNLLLISHRSPTQLEFEKIMTWLEVTLMFCCELTKQFFEMVMTWPDLTELFSWLDIFSHPWIWSILILVSNQ